VNSGLRSFFAAGFECSTLKRADGQRLDLIASTGHDRLVRPDYEQIRAHGIRTARDGLRWHLIERRPEVYEWQSWLPMLRASRSAGVQVIWDLCHYGWPDGLDIWSVEFVNRFARYSRAAAHVMRDESDDIPYFCPINEISYWAWAGGEVGSMNPGTSGRGAELKRQLVRAYLAAVDAVRSVDRRARFVIAEPLINVVSRSRIACAPDAADLYRRAQFETHDMLAGIMEPALGGARAVLDLIGVNFYPDNQWYLDGSTIPLGHHAYRPLKAMLVEVYERYHKPVFLAETGAEGSARSYWLHHVCAEVARAMRDGIPIAGICLYPILDYHGWENDRLCPVGLLSMPGPGDRRYVDKDLAVELQRQSTLLATLPSREHQIVARP
jgi:hypothetical protein